MMRVRYLMAIWDKVSIQLWILWGYVEVFETLGGMDVYSTSSSSSDDYV